MSRKEAVLLVSRALAMIQLITAFLEITTLPVRLISLSHYTSRINASTAIPPDYYFKSQDEVSIAFMWARIVGLLVFAFLFWNCGPWVERVLLPKREEAGSAD
jgi:hypothetical protein